MLKIEIVLYIIGTHYLADFIFQTREMARNKSTSLKALSLHVLVYGLVSGLLWSAKFPINTKFWIYLGLNTILHFIVDFFSSKISSYLYQNKREHEFWSVIGYDQVVHYACLFGTFPYFFF